MVIGFAIFCWAANVMYEVFMTGREDVIMGNLNGGKYDQVFHDIDKVQREVVR